MSRLITLAIHTYERALLVRTLLENEGIRVELNNVNLEVPGFSSGVRVRIRETDLPLALRIVENQELFSDNISPAKSCHTFLVPVDFSEHSFKAAIVGCTIASRHNAAVDLLYSYIDPYISGKMQLSDSLSYEIGENGARQQMKEAGRMLMSHFAERLRRQMLDGSIPAVTEGVPEDAIVDYAKLHTPRLIVMGTREARKKESDMIGSITAEVLDEGRFTVLTVPETVAVEKSLHPKNILFFSNIDQNDILAMDTLYRLFGSDAASVTIVHVPKKSRFNAAKRRARFRPRSSTKPTTKRSQPPPASRPGPPPPLTGRHPHARNTGLNRVTTNAIKMLPSEAAAKSTLIQIDTCKPTPV